jgi:hypothetical protein
MDFKYLKDFAISLTIIKLFAFALRDAALYKKVNKVPAESEYTTLSVSASLMATIQDIEKSIQDRKMFVFTVTKHPLKQDLIVQDKLDLLAEWRNMVMNTARLSSTFVDEKGIRTAIIAYQGKDGYYNVGDYVAGRRIDDILSGKVVYSINGQKAVMVLEPIPPKPVELENSRNTNAANQQSDNY